jgi:ParB-like nuclease domain
LIDYGLRTKVLSPLFFLLFLREIRAALKVTQLMAVPIETKPRLNWSPHDTRHHPRRRRRIVISDVVIVPISTIRFHPERRDADADQLLVDEVLARGQSLKAFLSRQEANPTKHYWTGEYSKDRVGAIENLLEANPAEFVLTVFPEDTGRFIVLDGHHRLRIAQLKGLSEVHVVIGVPGVPTIDWDNPSSVFLSRLIDKTPD